MLVRAKSNFPDTPIARVMLDENREALVDPDQLDRLIMFNWFAKKSFYRYYAVRTTHIDGRKVFIRMHRVIAETPRYQVCHHINGNALDNRRANLLNMNPYDHKILHSWR